MSKNQLKRDLEEIFSFYDIKLSDVELDKFISIKFKNSSKNIMETIFDNKLILQDYIFQFITLGNIDLFIKWTSLITLPYEITWKSFHGSYFSILKDLNHYYQYNSEIEGIFICPKCQSHDVEARSIHRSLGLDEIENCQCTCNKCGNTWSPF